MNSIRIEELSALATGRTKSLFSEDVTLFQDELRRQIEGSRVLAIGASGSIGAATVRQLVSFNPDALHVVDQNENSLVELVRDLRSRFQPAQLRDFRTLPLKLGSPILVRFLNEQRPYDTVLNFAALKHVRSEKDCYSILQMLETNVIQPLHLLESLAQRGGVRRYFCVSTDKAANPVNLMGASKRLMEHVIFSREAVGDVQIKVASARFANVAFSDGSLLQGWLMRLAHRQPLAVPRDTRRYFVSLEEAGQICLLAAFIAPDRHLLVPRFRPDEMLELSQLAVRVLERFGLKTKVLEDEDAARMAGAAPNGSYPLLLTPLDTSGEKAYEEFVGDGEESVDLALPHLLGVRYFPLQSGSLSEVLNRIEAMVHSPNVPVTREALIGEMKKLLPEFQHHASSKSLDQRL